MEYYNYSIHIKIIERINSWIKNIVEDWVRYANILAAIFILIKYQQQLQNRGGYNLYSCAITDSNI